MDIQFYGANCVVISIKQVRVVIDDNLTELGGKSVLREGDIALFTAGHGAATKQPKIAIDQPGEYEVQGISIYGIAARSHMDEPGKLSATLYKIVSDEITLLITGHIYPDLTDDELENIGTVDIMVVPVGGHGYTLDAEGALTLIKKLEPKLVIPTHFADNSLHFPIPQSELNESLKTLSMEPKETVAKLRVKPTDLSDVTQLVVLEKL